MVDRPSFDYDSGHATVYEAGRGISDEAELVWRAAVSPSVESAEVIVDVGAGTGRFARRLAGLAPGRTIAVEPARGMRRAANDVAATAALPWVGGRAETLPLRTSSVDLVWIAFVVHYLDLRSAAEEFARVLRPGGRVLVWSAFPDVFDDLAWFRYFPTARAIDEARMPSAESVRNAFEAGGLRFESRTEHRKLIADDLTGLAERMSHRAISTLELISDDDYHQGMADLRAAAAAAEPAPIYSTNVMLTFAR